MGITLQDAEKYFEKNIKNYSAFTLDELAKQPTDFERMLSRYDSHVSLLDDQKKQTYTDLLIQSFWKCANLPAVRYDQLKALVASPYFKAEKATTDNKSILMAAIDFCKERNDDAPLRAILTNPKILNNLHVKDAHGNLPTDYAIQHSFTNLALKVLIEKQAKCQFCYDSLAHIQMISDDNLLNDVLRLHKNINLKDPSSHKTLAEIAYENKNDEMLCALIKHGASFDSGLLKEGVKGLITKTESTIRRKCAEKYYYHHLYQQSVTLLDTSLDVSKLRQAITTYDIDFKHVDEQKQYFYMMQLINLFQKFAKEKGNIDQLRIIAQSPFFKSLNEKYLHALIDIAVDLCKGKSTNNAEPLQVLLSIPSFRDCIFQKYSHFSSDDVHLPFYKILLQNNAKLSCEYDDLCAAKQKFSSQEFDVLLQSTKNINELLPVMIQKKNDTLIAAIDDAKLMSIHPSFTKEIADIHLRFNNRNTAEAFYKYYMLKKDSVEFELFTTGELKETPDKFKALVAQYDLNMSRLDEKHQSHYSRLLMNTFKENLKNPVLCLDRLQTITSSPYFIFSMNDESKKILDDSIALCRKDNDIPLQALFSHSGFHDFRVDDKLNDDMTDDPLFKFLLKNNVKFITPYSAFIKYSEKYTWDQLQPLLNVQVNINVQDEKGFSFAERALQDQNYSFLLALHKAGANLDCALEIGGIDTVEEKAKDEEKKADAEKFYAKNIKGFSRFTDDEFDKNEKDFPALIAYYEKHVPDMKSEYQKEYKTIIWNSVGSCMQYRPHHLNTLIHSQYFNLLGMFKDDQPVIHHVVSMFDHELLHSDEVIKIFSKHKDIARALELEDKNGELPANNLCNKPQKLKLLADCGAKINVKYDRLRAVSFSNGFRDLMIVMRAHRNVNSIDPVDKLSFAEYAVMDSDYYMLNALHQLKVDVRRALAMGSLECIRRLKMKKKFFPSGAKNTALLQIFNDFEQNTQLFDLHFCEIIKDILERNLNAKTIEKIINFHPGFKERVFSFIKLLPKEAQAYIYTTSMNKESLLFKLWTVPRGYKQVSPDRGMFGKVRHEYFECKKNVKAYDLQETLYAISQFNQNLEAEINFVPDNKIISNHITTDYEKTTLLKAEVAFSENHPELKLNNVEHWGYTFAIAGIDRIKNLKHKIRDDFDALALYGKLEEAIANHEINFGNFFDAIKSNKISPKILKKIANMYPDLCDRLLNYMQAENPHTQLAFLTDTTSPFIIIWQSNLKKVQKKIDSLNKLSSSDKNFKLIDMTHLYNMSSEENTLYQNFKSALQNYQRDKKTCDPGERARINARIEIATICLNSLADRKPLVSNILEVWETEYRSLNIFKMGSYFLSFLDSDLMKNIRKLLQYQSQKNISVSVEQFPPPFAPSFMEDQSIMQSSAPLFVSAPTVASSSFLPPTLDEAHTIPENDVISAPAKKRLTNYTNFFREEPKNKNVAKQNLKIDTTRKTVAIT